MKKTIAFLAALMLTACSGEEPAKVVTLSGKTMGTTFNITAVGVPEDLDEADLSGAVEAVLADVNAKLSNWDKTSEVSRFNSGSEISPVKVSGDFVAVMKAANDVHDVSGGKFDVTLGPLIELWGFGPRKPEDPLPTDAAVEKALEFVGQSTMLSVDAEASTISKSAPEVGINLSAIAKGYGIDAVAAKLKELGVGDYMVEIGGDLVTAGKNDKGEAWRIGIEKPDPGEQAVELIVSLDNKGLATSGDYRNFVEYDGIRYSHIIDPVTGKPITHWTTSVSVLADDAMMADAWATAMLVLGSEKGLEIAEANDIAVYFISRDENGAKGDYVTEASSAFTALQGAK